MDAYGSQMWMLKTECYRLMEGVWRVLCDSAWLFVGMAAVALAVVLAWHLLSGQQRKEAEMPEQSSVVTPINASSGAAKIKVVGQVVAVFGDASVRTLSINADMGPKEFGTLEMAVGLFTATGGEMTLERAGVDVAASKAEMGRRLAALK